MKKEIFTGSGVAIITPMNQDGSINYAELEKLIEFQIQNGTDATSLVALQANLLPCHMRNTVKSLDLPLKK